MLAAREKNGIFVSPENYEDMQNTIECQKDSIAELTEKIAAYEEEIDKIQTIFGETSAKLVRGDD